MQFNIKKISSLSVLFLLLGIMLAYLYFHWEDFRALKFVSPLLIIFLALLLLLNFFILGLSNKILLKPLHIHLGVMEATTMSLMTGFYNLITPFKGGLAARAVYLNKKHQSSYADFVSATSVYYLILFLVASFVGIISTLFILLKYHNFNFAIFAVFLLMFIALFTLFSFNRKLPYGKSRIINLIISVINGYQIIRKDSSAIRLSIILATVQISVSAIMLTLQFKVFGNEIDFITALFLVSIGSLGVLVSITPSGLGITEAITVFSALSLGIQPVESLSAALLGRVVSILVLFIFGPISSYLLLRAKPYHQRLDTRRTESIEEAYSDLKLAFEKTQGLKYKIRKLKDRYYGKNKKIKIRQFFREDNRKTD